MPNGNKSFAAQWTSMAKAWGQNGPPLRPNADDVACFQKSVDLWQARHPGKSLRALILGVTPELYRLHWPAGAEVRAADRTEAMIEHVWPGRREAVIHSDWLQIAPARASVDLVLCDGGLHLLSYPEGQSILIRKLTEIVAPGGYCVFRLFVPPAMPETPSAVIADLLSGGIPNLNYLKLRLTTAMQASKEAGVALDDVWRFVHAVEPDQEALAGRLGWAKEHLEIINFYHGSPARYHFVDVDTAVELFCQATRNAFEVHRVDVPDYPMGRQCPTLTFLRTS